MKTGWMGVVMGVVLAGCGGGGGAPPAPPVATQPPPALPATGPGAAVRLPTVTVVSGNVQRQVVAGTGIAIEARIQPSFTPIGTLHASLAGNEPLLAPEVGVTPNADGSYTLSLNTVAAIPAGTYQGNFVIKLCADPACATLQHTPSIEIPYAITAGTASNAWPGDLVMPLNPWPNAPDWSTFQGNASHTGYMPVTLNPDRFALRWKNGSLGSITALGTSSLATLAASNGLFYLPKNNRLEARKELDGSLVWSHDVGTLAYPSVNPVAVANGVVYMAAGERSSSFMFAFDASTGSVGFRTPMGAQWATYLAPAVYDGTVYTNAGTYGGLYAIKSTGELLFTAAAPQADRWSPAVDANSAYVFLENALTVYDRKTGLQRRQIKDTAAGDAGFHGAGAPVLGAPGSVIAASYTGADWNGPMNVLLGFDVDKGVVNWRVPGTYVATPAYAKGIVYAPNKSPYRLEARAESDGALRWSWTPPRAGERSWAGEPVVTDNLVFVSTDEATYAVDLRTGKTVWSYPLSGRLVLTRSAMLYIHAREALVAVGVN